ncbi:MAG: DUF2066 domain-containing protein [Pseudomonadota bacterium]
MTRFRRPAVLALVLAVLAATPAWAQSAAEAFSVRGIDVDVTAANVTQAKEQAIADGQRQAFRLLLERLTAPEDHPRLPAVDGIEYVRDFSVEQERSTAVRYLATLTVRFNPPAVRKLLRDAGINYAEPRGRSVVVVPVFQPAQGKPVLWDDPNPWRAAWQRLGGGGLVPLTVPPGDLSDVQAMAAEQALAGDPERMRALSEAHRGADVMVVAAGIQPGGAGVDVLLHTSANAPKPFDSVAYRLADGESMEQLLARAARDIQRAIDTAYKQPNLLQFDRAASLSALVPLSGFEQWLGVRDALGRVPQVRRWELVSLSKAEAAVILHIVGDQEQVRGALARQGLTLDWADGYWTMRSAAH